MSDELATITSLLQIKSPLAAMLAPSFPIMYSYPQIVGKLKRLGFTQVVEVTRGAHETNKMAVERLRQDPKARFLTAPCPSFVRLIRTKYPHLVKYLALAADSPMVATAKIARDKYPGSRPVFIGPCNVKKLEAGEDYPDLEIIAITFCQLDQLFKEFAISDEESDQDAQFDIEYKQTRLYPISGGLAQSSYVKDLLADDAVEVVSGWQECEQALKRFEENDQIRLVDALFCQGGCINGPGIDSRLSLVERRNRIISFWKQGSKFFGQVKNLFTGSEKTAS